MGKAQKYLSQGQLNFSAKYWGALELTYRIGLGKKFFNRYLWDAKL